MMKKQKSLKHCYLGDRGIFYFWRFFIDDLQPFVVYNEIKIALEIHTIIVLVSCFKYRMYVQIHLWFSKTIIANDSGNNLDRIHLYYARNGLVWFSKRFFSLSLLFFKFFRTKSFWNPAAHRRRIILFRHRIRVCNDFQMIVIRNTTGVKARTEYNMHIRVPRIGRANIRRPIII